MHDRNRKYIYASDKMGEVIGYVDDLQPSDEDTIFIIIISEKPRGAADWSSVNRDCGSAILPKQTKERKFYEDYEEFCTEYFDAIL